MSFTLHDYGPISDASMSAKSRILWSSAMIVNARRADIVHVYHQNILDDRRAAIMGNTKAVVASPPLGESASPVDRGEARHHLFVGTVSRRKRVPEMIDEFSAVQTKYPLILVGDGTEVYRGIPGVKAMGRVSEESLNMLYAHAASVVLLSEYEGFGLPVDEARSRGIPVIASVEVSRNFHLDKSSGVFALELGRKALGEAEDWALAFRAMTGEVGPNKEHPVSSHSPLLVALGLLPHVD